MPRPSRNLDRALLAAGRELLPYRGCAGLSIREVAEAAGVNLGMFHYHFRSREVFLRTLLQQMYEECFVQLAFEGANYAGPVENLRAALRFLGRFLRTNRLLIGRVLADALCGEPVALDFLRANVPRHLGLLRALLGEGQEAGLLRRIAVAQAIGVCAGAVAMPLLFGGAIADRTPRATARALTKELLTDAAIDERIELALAALAAPGARVGGGAP